MRRALADEDFDRYQAEAAKTSGPLNRLARAALGYFGEREEYLEHRRFAGERSDAIAELGDRAWYLADLCTELDLSLTAAVRSTPSSISRIAELPKKLLRGDPNRQRDELRVLMPSAIAAAWFELEAHAVRHIEQHQDVRELMREILEANIEKLADRQARGVIRGSGDHR